MHNLNNLTVNYHVLKQCNMKCRYCYATFAESVHGVTKDKDPECAEPWKSRNPGKNWRRELIRHIVSQLQPKKINFAGGEPTLFPRLGDLIKCAKHAGAEVSLISNGYQVAKLLQTHRDYIDLVGFSLDAPTHAQNAIIGRESKKIEDIEDTVRFVIERARLCHRYGIPVKLNTVVTAKNYETDMTEVVQQINP